jgi:hypothetical protein
MGFHSYVSQTQKTNSRVGRMYRIYRTNKVRQVKKRLRPFTSNTPKPVPVREQEDEIEENCTKVIRYCRKNGFKLIMPSIATGFLLIHAAVPIICVINPQHMLCISTGGYILSIVIVAAFCVIAVYQDYYK